MSAAGCGALASERYEAAFRENEIDETVLASLTHANLKELGVTALGHRLKLLDAISALSGDKSDQATAADAGPLSGAPSVSPEDRAERRQVTVMFSDLVGSAHCRRVSTLKTSARSSPRITSALPRRCDGSAGSFRNISAMASLSISATRRRMKMTLSGRFEQDWN